MVAPDGSKQRAFVGLDENLMQAKTRVGSRRLAEALEKVHPALACHVDRRKGRASLSWEPFVELKVDIPADPSATRYSLVWDYEIVDKHNIDKDAVLAAFSDLEPSRREPSFRP